jgi:hypothetical protein
MKSKKNPQGKKEIRKTKISTTKPTAKKESKPATIHKASIEKKPDMSANKAVKTTHKSSKIHNIPEILKDFYRE